MSVWVSEEWKYGQRCIVLICLQCSSDVSNHIYKDDSHLGIHKYRNIFFIGVFVLVLFIFAHHSHKEWRMGDNKAYSQLLLC